MIITQAEENRVSEISLPTLRGVIYDRNGIVLARNIASYDLSVVAADLPDSEGAIQEIYRQLSELLDWPVNLGDLETTPYNPCVSELGIAQVVTYAQTSSPYKPVKILCNIDEDDARIIQEKAVDWPGIEIEVDAVRDYPTGELTASLVGFLGPISAADEAYYARVDLTRWSHDGHFYILTDSSMTWANAARRQWCPRLRPGQIISLPRIGATSGWTIWVWPANRKRRP